MTREQAMRVYEELEGVRYLHDFPAAPDEDMPAETVKMPVFNVLIEAGTDQVDERAYKMLVVPIGDTAWTPNEQIREVVKVAEANDLQVLGADNGFVIQ